MCTARGIEGYLEGNGMKTILLRKLPPIIAGLSVAYWLVCNRI